MYQNPNVFFPSSERYFNLLILVLYMVVSSHQLGAQDSKYKAFGIGFYNVENLFDTVNDTLINDEEFLPDGQKAWTQEKYKQKIASTASVIAQIGKGVCKEGLSLLGVSEIENETVLQDLVDHPLLASRNYGYMHKDSWDRRGIDVALIYDKDVFQPLDLRCFHVDISKGDSTNYRRTRDVLLFSGLLDGEAIHVTVNHWPSRSGGEKRSEHGRIAAAKVNKRILDSLLVRDPDAKLIVMGDLNDNPDNDSVTKYLHAKKKEKKVADGEMYNPMRKLYDKGLGTTAWRDRWSLFDQIIVSPGLMKKNNASFYLQDGHIYNKSYLLQKKGKYKGYPLRTFDGDVYQGGYSDHLPVYIFLLKEV